MTATQFEYRRQTLLHLLVVGLAALAYAVDPVDIVWAAVRNHADSRHWERLVFGFGAVLLFASALLETWANAHRENAPEQAVTPARRGQLRLARTLLVLSVGLLLPLPGTIILLTGETILLVRLFFHGGQRVGAPPSPPRSSTVRWSSGFRSAASNWGLTATMIAFVWTLQDRVAEVGAACSVAVWLLLKIPAGYRSNRS